MEVLNWITANQEALVALLGALVVVVGAATKLMLTLHGIVKKLTEAIEEGDGFINGTKSVMKDGDLNRAWLETRFLNRSIKKARSKFNAAGFKVIE